MKENYVAGGKHGLGLHRVLSIGQGTGDTKANKSPTSRSLGVQPEGRPVYRETLEKEEGGAEHRE